MGTTDRRTLLTAGLASLVIVLALAVAAVVAALAGGYCCGAGSIPGLHAAQGAA